MCAFSFEGEPGSPGEAGQSGLPGPKVGTDKAKHCHLLHGFQTVLSCHSLLSYFSGCSWVDLFVMGIICGLRTL